MLSGRVIGRWGEDTALVRVEDGRTVEVPVPEELRDGFDVGSEVALTAGGNRLMALEPAPAR